MSNTLLQHGIRGIRMPRYSERFKNLVNEILERHGSQGTPMSTRNASERTRREVTHVMVGDFTKGFLPTDPDKIRLFADALKEPRVPLLEATESYSHRPFKEDYEYDRKHYGKSADSLPNERSDSEGNDAFETLDGEVMEFAEALGVDALLRAKRMIPRVAQAGEVVALKVKEVYGADDAVLYLMPDGDVSFHAYEEAVKIEGAKILGEFYGTVEVKRRKL